MLCVPHSCRLAWRCAQEHNAKLILNVWRLANELSMLGIDGEMWSGLGDWASSPKKLPSSHSLLQIIINKTCGWLTMMLS